MASNLDRLEDLISNQIIADLETHLTEMLLTTRAAVEEFKIIKVENKRLAAGLQSIITHQEMIAGELAPISATVQIAKRALENES